MLRARAAAVAAPALATLVACGAGAPQPTPVVVTHTPAVSLVALQVAITAPATKSFIVHGGHWRVCDHGTVTNPGATTAMDVRVTVTYIDHMAVVGRLTTADAATDGGALGDIPPGEVRSFTICGLASNEPDSDVVSAAPTG